MLYYGKLLRNTSSDQHTSSPPLSLISHLTGLFHFFFTSCCCLFSTLPLLLHYLPSFLSAGSKRYERNANPSLCINLPSLLSIFAPLFKVLVFDRRMAGISLSLNFWLLFPPAIYLSNSFGGLFLTNGGNMDGGLYAFHLLGNHAYTIPWIGCLSVA